MVKSCDLILIVVSGVLVTVANGFLGTPFAGRGLVTTAATSTLLSENKQGYKFGDITRSLTKRSTNRIKSLTGKDKYEFGDLSRWLDQQAKETVTNMTGQDTYEFGDLTRMADQLAKDKISNYTGKAGYKFGDLSKEILRRTWEGEYLLEDVWLALKLLISYGLGITSLTRLMPIKVLLELINVGLAQQATGRAMEVLAGTLDERMKAALTGNSKYQLGDITKDKLTRALQEFTGKESYKFGDIGQKISSLATYSGEQTNTKEIHILDDKTMAAELRSWDAKFQKDAMDKT
jgi:hypothetical protein